MNASSNPTPTPPCARDALVDAIDEALEELHDYAATDHNCYPSETDRKRTIAAVLDAAEVVIVSRETAITAENYLFWACERSEGNNDEDNEAWWELCHVLGIDQAKRIAALAPAAPAREGEAQ